MIEILKFEMINKGSLIARFNVKMLKWGGIIIKDWSLFEVGEKRWINAPSKQYEADGKKKWSPYLFYEDRALEEAFKGAIMKAVDEYMQKMSQHNSNINKSNFEDVPF